jgi:hypothetical protein
MPQNNNPISKDQAIFISQLLSVIPTPDNGPTARRGFALQAAKQADVAEFFPGWQLDHESVTAGSKIIDTLMADKKAKDDARKGIVSDGPSLRPAGEVEAPQPDAGYDDEDRGAKVDLKNVFANTGPVHHDDEDDED